MLSTQIINTKGLGLRIKNIVQIRNINDEELSKKLNITTRTLRCIYSGSNCPSFPLLYSISNELNAPLDYLLVDSLNNKTPGINFMLMLYFNNTYDERLIKFVKEYINLRYSKE